MQDSLLPLFPLELVLFPGARLPLHIFEDRYKEMVGEARRDQTEFGIVMATQKGLADTGCTARIDRVLREYDDGRMDILTLGRRRFEILLVNQERSFLRGSVEFFDDDPEIEDAPRTVDLAELRARATAAYQEFCSLTKRDPLTEAETQDAQMSFRMAQAVDDLSFRQRMLTTRNEAERLKQILAFLPQFTRDQSRIQRVKDAAPRNGHGHKHVD